MTDQPSTLLTRAEATAKAKARRAKRIERREACLELITSGYSHRQVATALNISLDTVRREVGKALADRPVEAPERYASLQVARLTKALLHADLRIERGDIRAFAPYIKLTAALDRYHGFHGVRARSHGVRVRSPLPGPASSVSEGALAAPRLALTQAAPALPKLPSDVARSGAQDIENAGAPVDIAGRAGSKGPPPLAMTEVEPPLPPLDIARSGAQGVEIAGAPVDIAGCAGSDGPDCGEGGSADAVAAVVPSPFSTSSASKPSFPSRRGTGAAA